ncbi:MAG: hypothetical protein EBU84_15125 [Actinobacteria bacterium]|nr:hypothetical protein [Actinomycetota bacterium]
MLAELQVLDKDFLGLQVEVGLIVVLDPLRLLQAVAGVVPQQQLMDYLVVLVEVQEQVKVVIQYLHLGQVILHQLPHLKEIMEEQHKTLEELRYEQVAEVVEPAQLVLVVMGQHHLQMVVQVVQVFKLLLLDQLR